jgi:hypothetical protein
LQRGAVALLEHAEELGLLGRVGELDLGRPDDARALSVGFDRECSLRALEAERMDGLDIAVAPPLL